MHKNSFFKGNSDSAPLDNPENIPDNEKIENNQDNLKNNSNDITNILKTNITNLNSIEKVVHNFNLEKDNRKNFDGNIELGKINDVSNY